LKRPPVKNAPPRKADQKTSTKKAEADEEAEVEVEAEAAPEPEAAAPAASNGPKPAKRRATAESMAAGQRDISVSEFFAKNRHLLGFDNPRKALLTSVKEAVDNSLDACEEAGILPEVWVHIETTGNNRYKVGVQDNGPGLVKAQIPNIFGKLLDGHKFPRLDEDRGQRRPSCRPEAFDHLPGHICDEVEVPVDVEDREMRHLCGGGHKQVRDRRRPGQAALGQACLDRPRPNLQGRRAGPPGRDIPGAGRRARPRHRPWGPRPRW